MSSNLLSPKDPAIVARGLGKSYKIRHKTSVPGKRFSQTTKETVWALRDVSFDIAKGEVVGLVGRNGAGKSTLLKLLSHITEPAEGQIALWGRVGSLLEVGTGFHPELTGRENVFLNGAVLGMTRAEIRGKFDDIIDFAGVHRYLDTPVKRYSSGMYVRLAFSVAVHLRPEVLIVDEVLAVGDADFQRRCLAKMDEVSKSGITVLLVSHNMGSIQSLCQRAILLEQGRLTMDGPAEEVVATYLAKSLESGASVSDEPEARPGNGLARVHDVRVLDQEGRPTTQVMGGEDVLVQVDYECTKPGTSVSVSMTLYNDQEAPVAAAHTYLTRPNLAPMATTGTLTCRLRRLPLTIGLYRIAMALQIDDETADHVARAAELDVSASVFYDAGVTLDSKTAAVMLDHEWQHEPSARTVAA
jgi:lipopolysaccharide transport system ATP-binding protein